MFVTDFLCFLGFNNRPCKQADFNTGTNWVATRTGGGTVCRRTDARSQPENITPAPAAGAWLCAALHRRGALVLGGRRRTAAGAWHAALGGGEHGGFVSDFLPGGLGGVSHLAKRR